MSVCANRFANNFPRIRKNLQRGERNQVDDGSGNGTRSDKASSHYIIHDYCTPTLFCTNLHSANKIQQVVGILKASTQCRKIYNELPFSRSALWIKMFFLKGSKGFKGSTGFKWVLRSP